MRLVLTGRNVEITPALERLVARQVRKLDRVLNDSAISAQVVLSLQKYRHVTEITVHARGDHMLRGLADTTQWQTSLTTSVEKIAQQAHKLKDKWETRKRRAASGRALAAEAVGETGPRTPRIIRTAQHLTKPMTLEDAAIRVDASTEGVLLFRNAATDAINILYRRKDGNLGLIEPEA